MIDAESWLLKPQTGSRTHSKSMSPHRFPIPEDTYTLLGHSRHRFWAIGRRLPDQKFEKVSVIVMDNLDDEEKQKLEDLSPVARSRNVLV